MLGGVRAVEEVIMIAGAATGSGIRRLRYGMVGGGPGIKDELTFVRRVDFAPSSVAFDAAMQK